jgi:N-acetylneuraminate synthase
VRLGAIAELKTVFPDAVIGLSDHTTTNYTSLASVALGASIIERHFTSDKSWPGPDINISMDPSELADLIVGSRAVHSALGGSKQVLIEEQPTIDFAYASVVTIRPIGKGETFTMENIWVKRPGTGEILAIDFKRVLGMHASRRLEKNIQLSWSDVTE